MGSVRLLVKTGVTSRLTGASSGGSGGGRVRVRAGVDDDGKDGQAGVIGGSRAHWCRGREFRAWVTGGGLIWSA